MNFSKEDFGYHFSTAVEDHAAEPLVSERVNTGNIVVTVDYENQKSGNLEHTPEAAHSGEEAPQKQQHLEGMETHLQFAKDEVEFKFLKPHNFDEDAAEEGTTAALSCCGICCCLTIFAAIGGGILVFVSNRKEFGENQQDLKDTLFFVGSGLLFAGAFCYLCGWFSCCLGCVLACSNLDEEDNGKPTKDFTILLERYNDQYSKNRDQLGRLRADVTSKFRGSVKEIPVASKLVLKEKKRLQKAKKEEVSEMIKRDLGNNLTPAMVSRKLRPNCFRIDFNGDMNVSHMDVFREQISIAIDLGTSGLDIVVVVITSPGGAVTSYGLAASQLVRIKNAGLKLVVCVDSVAASGGYMMASVADEIYAAPFAIVGSIGVISVIPNVEDFLRKHDVRTHVLTAGNYKNTVNVVGDVTEEGIEKYKEELEKIHAAFKHHIIVNRPQLADHIDEIATGEAFLAVEGRKLGLVDHIKTSDEYLENMADHYEVFDLKWKKKKASGFGDFVKASGVLSSFSMSKAKELFNRSYLRNYKPVPQVVDHLIGEIV